MATALADAREPAEPTPFERVADAAGRVTAEHARTLLHGLSTARTLFDEVAEALDAPDGGFMDSLSDNPLVAIDDSGWITAGVAFILPRKFPGGAGRGENELRGAVSLQLFRAPYLAQVAFGAVAAADRYQSVHQFDGARELAGLVVRAALAALETPLTRLRAPEMQVGFRR